MVYEKGTSIRLDVRRTTVSTIRGISPRQQHDRYRRGARLVRAIADRAGARRRSRQERTRRRTRPHEIAADSTWPGQQDSLALRLALCRICESFSFEFASSWHEVIVNKNTEPLIDQLFTGFSRRSRRPGVGGTHCGRHARSSDRHRDTHADRGRTTRSPRPSAYHREDIDQVVADIKDLVRFEPGVPCATTGRFTAAGARPAATATAASTSAASKATAC